MSIIRILDQFLTNNERPIFNPLAMTVHVDEDVEHRKFRVSDAGRCHLYQYWKRQGKEQPAKGVPELKVMELGNLLHAWLEYALQKSEVLQNAELLVEDDHRKGHADALVRLNGKPVLYDFKTIGAKQAWYMLNNGAKAKREHQFQVLTYLAMLTHDPSNPFAAGLADARILYVTREEVKGKQGEVLPPLTVIADVAADLDLLPAVRKNWDILIAAWEKHKEPQASPEAWECRYCPYHNSCEQGFLRD